MILRWRTQNLRIKRLTKLIAAITIAILLAIGVLAATYYLNPPSTILGIKNRTGENLIIKKVFINKKPIDTAEKFLAHDGHSSLQYTFAAHTNATLNLIIKYNEDRELELSCALKDEEGFGCIYYAIIKKGPLINCFCDGYGDSSNTNQSNRDTK